MLDLDLKQRLKRVGSPNLAILNHLCLSKRGISPGSPLEKVHSLAYDTDLVTGMDSEERLYRLQFLGAIGLTHLEEDAEGNSVFLLSDGVRTLLDCDTVPTLSRRHSETETLLQREECDLLLLILDRIQENTVADVEWISEDDAMGSGDTRRSGRVYLHHMCNDIGPILKQRNPRVVFFSARLPANVSHGTWEKWIDVQFQKLRSVPRLDVVLVDLGLDDNALSRLYANNMNDFKFISISNNVHEDIRNMFFLNILEEMQAGKDERAAFLAGEVAIAHLLPATESQVLRIHFV